MIRHAGLSEVSVREIEAARNVFKVATVQNQYNLGDRSSEDVLDYCEKHGIGFIPWFPLAPATRGARRSLDDDRRSVTRRRRARSPWPGS